MKHKCCECESELDFDSNCKVDMGIGHFYCTNDDCITIKQGGTVKVDFETKKIYYE
jgi:hypothetical protein|tara:strand:- start:233 stop:400 length:168 start_codon:yes stop_codon:yes gene_type:complete